MSAAPPAAPAAAPAASAAGAPVGPPRARGRVALSALPADPGASSRPSSRPATRLGALRQEGSLKALFPRPSGPALEAVLLNTAGGLTGGDRMAVEARAEAGARLCLSTQAAERVYRAADGTARAEARLAVGEGARIDWLPQETILFEGGRLERTLRADLHPEGTLLAVEAILLGRLARGERLRDAHLSDRWEIRRGGRLVLADALRLSGDLEARMGRAAVGGGARALATLVLVAPTAEALLAPVRALLPATGGASLVREGVLVARLLAADGFALRRSLVPLIVLMSGAAAAPRVWTL